MSSKSLFAPGVIRTNTPRRKLPRSLLPQSRFAAQIAAETLPSKASAPLVSTSERGPERGRARAWGRHHHHPGPRPASLPSATRLRRPPRRRPRTLTLHTVGSDSLTPTAILTAMHCLRFRRPKPLFRITDTSPDEPEGPLSCRSCRDEAVASALSRAAADRRLPFMPSIASALVDAGDVRRVALLLHPSRLLMQDEQLNRGADCRPEVRKGA